MGAFAHHKEVAVGGDAGTLEIDLARGIEGEPNGVVLSPAYLVLTRALGELNPFPVGEVSSELCGSRTVEKVNNDVDCTSHGSRQEQKADGQPEESTNTLKLAFSFRLRIPGQGDRDSEVIPIRIPKLI